ncbi:MAG: hypothetical protein ACOY3I_06745 [Verrucomicrobiota bacterium]
MNWKKTGVLLGGVLLAGMFCTQTWGYSAPVSPASSDEDDPLLEVDARLMVIEKKMSQLANAYQKTRQAIQIIAKKMQAESASGADNGETQMLVKGLSDRVERIEAILEAIAQRPVTQGNAATDKETLAVLDVLSEKVEHIETSVNAVAKRTLYATQSGQGGQGATIVADPELISLMESLERRMQKMETSMDALAQGRANSGAPNTSKMEAVLEKLERRMQQMEASLNMFSKTGTDPTITNPRVESLMEETAGRLAKLESAVESLAKRPATASLSKETSVAYAMDREAMILLKAISEKIDALESNLKNASPAIDMEALAQMLQQQSGAAAMAHQPFASIMGAVRAPGRVILDQGGKKDLLSAMADVSGFTPNADPTSVTVRRGPKVFTIDVTRIMQENLLSFDLEHGDIVVVKEKEGVAPSPVIEKPKQERRAPMEAPKSAPTIKKSDPYRLPSTIPSKESQEEQKTKSEESEPKETSRPFSMPPRSTPAPKTETPKSKQSAPLGVTFSEPSASQEISKPISTSQAPATFKSSPTLKKPSETSKPDAILREPEVDPQPAVEAPRLRPLTPQAGKSAAPLSFIPENNHAIEIRREPLLDLRQEPQNETEVDFEENSNEKPELPAKEIYRESPVSVLHEEECEIQTEPDGSQDSMASQFARQGHWDKDAFYRGSALDVRY